MYLLDWHLRTYTGTGARQKRSLEFTVWLFRKADIRLGEETIRNAARQNLRKWMNEETIGWIDETARSIFGNRINVIEFDFRQ
jgi:hypothetical protein